MIIILGIAGSGKSTQGRLLAQRLHCTWISVGELLRSSLSGEMHEQLDEGKIIDDTKTLALLEKKLATEKADQNECILDGAPRTLEQAKWLSQQISAGKIKLTAVFHLQVPEEQAKTRLVTRGRADDHEAAIANRFNEYEQTILPIIDYLKQQGISVHDVSSEGSINEVADRIQAVLR